MCREARFELGFRGFDGSLLLLYNELKEDFWECVPVLLNLPSFGMPVPVATSLLKLVTIAF